MSWQKTEEKSFVQDYCEVDFNGEFLRVQNDKKGLHGYAVSVSVPLNVIVELLTQYGYSVRESGQ